MLFWPERSGRKEGRWEKLRDCERMFIFRDEFNPWWKLLSFLLTNRLVLKMVQLLWNKYWPFARSLLGTALGIGPRSILDRHISLPGGINILRWTLVRTLNQVGLKLKVWIKQTCNYDTLFSQPKKEYATFKSHTSGCTTCDYSQSHWTVQFKWLNCIVCKLYPNKAGFFFNKRKTRGMRRLLPEKMLLKRSHASYFSPS